MMIARADKSRLDERTVRSYAVESDALTALPAGPEVRGFSTAEIEASENQLAQMSKRLATLATYCHASEVTGGFVKLLPQYACLPLLIDATDVEVPLYHFIEALEEIIEYDDLKPEFPHLSYSQMSSALAFLRKLAQFNTKGIDIDALEDEHLEGSAEFRQIIAAAANDRGPTRVLDAE